MTDKVVCDLCGETAAFDYLAEVKFVYGAGPDEAILTATVLVTECSSCGEAVTGEHAEIQRELAVRRHLACVAENAAC
ncbi:hypothetical protein O9X98_10690 [Agrobacterium salinitolerans]|nr:hypothetical protein [Agrobacterium salinitolerans]